PPRVVALPVDDGGAQARGGKAVAGESGGEDVFGGPLPDPVRPVAVVGMARRGLRHQRPVVVALPRRRGPWHAYEVDLARADEDVVPDGTLEDPHRAPRVPAHEAGEIHGGVEAAAGQGTVERVRGAIAMEALDALAERVGQCSSIEDGAVVPAAHHPPDEVVAYEAVPPDDEDVQEAASAALSAAGT